MGFETWLVRVMREVQPFIRDPDIAEEARLFTKQEAVHAAAHTKHVRALIARYPGLAETRERCIETFDAWRGEMSLQDNLCAIAALEATFTPRFKLIIDNRRVLMGGGVRRVASLLLWHFCEEIEHRSSALAIYRHVYGDLFGPARRFGAFRKRISDVMRMMRGQFRQHVPAEESSSRGRARSTAFQGRTSGLRPRGCCSPRRRGTSPKARRCRRGRTSGSRRTNAART